MGRLTEMIDFLNSDKIETDKYHSFNVTPTAKEVRKEYKKQLKVEAKKIKEAKNE